MHSRSVVVAALVAGGGFLPLRPVVAQGDAAPAPPPVLQIIREQVKVGLRRQHQANEAAWARALAQSPFKWIGMSAQSGPLGETWFLTGHASLAALQKTDEAFEAMPAMQRADSTYSARDASLLNEARTVIAVLRPDLGYGAPVDMAKMRYMEVTVFRVRPGREPDFDNVAKAYVAAYGKASMAGSWALYQVIAGMPQPTYMLFMPMASLEAVDQNIKMQAAVGQALTDAATVMKTWSEAAITAETNLFAFSPRMSNPAPEFAARDPEFWNKK